MNNLPSISSILSPKHVAEYVVRVFGFEETTDCSILKTGINHTYLISTTLNKFVFRIYFLNWRTKVEIEEEIKLLNHLHENGIGVSYPIMDKNKEYIQTVNSPEGMRFAVLFSFAEGETIKNPSELICYKLGLEMAKMHQFTQSRTIKRRNYDSESLVNRAYLSAGNFFEADSKEMQYFSFANSRVQMEFKNADHSNLRYGTVHLDLWYENMKIKNGSEFTFFDFDNCGNGWLFLDVSYTIMLLFRNEPDKELFNRKRVQFLQGYESITKLSEEEKRLIPYGGLAIWLHYTGVHIERFNDFSNHFLSLEFLKYWINTVKTWLKYNQVEIDTF